MSKDFTPKMFHLADRQYHISEVVFRDKDSDMIDQDTTEDMRRDFPNLTFLLECFPDLYRMSIRDVTLRSTLLEIEKILSEIIEKDDADETIRTDCEPYRTIVRWYNGWLDPNYYYNDENNRLFRDWILKYAHINNS